MLYICTNSQAYSSMKRLLAIILIVLTQVSAFASDSLSVIYRIRIDSDIDKSAQRLVTLGLEKDTVQGKGGLAHRVPDGIRLGAIHDRQARVDLADVFHCVLPFLHRSRGKHPSAEKSGAV